MIGMPRRFPGSREEREANDLTHDWWTLPDGDGERCGRCDCRRYGIVAEWPCGARVPVEPVKR